MADHPKGPKDRERERAKDRDMSIEEVRQHLAALVRPKGIAPTPPVTVLPLKIGKITYRVGDRLPGLSMNGRPAFLQWNPFDGYFLTSHHLGPFLGQEIQPLGDRPSVALHALFERQKEASRVAAVRAKEISPLIRELGEAAHQAQQWQEARVMSYLDTALFIAEVEISQQRRDEIAFLIIAATETFINKTVEDAEKLASDDIRELIRQIPVLVKNANKRWIIYYFSNNNLALPTEISHT